MRIFLGFNKGFSSRKGFSKNERGKKDRKNIKPVKTADIKTCFLSSFSLRSFFFQYFLNLMKHHIQAVLFFLLFLLLIFLMAGTQKLL